MTVIVKFVLILGREAEDTAVQIFRGKDIRFGILATAIALGFSTGAAQASTLTFDGNICGGAACSNGNGIDQSYGDIAGQVDVTYDGNRSTAALENVLFWGPNYETLSNVAYSINSTSGLSILFQAAAGYDIVLSAFDIAPYSNVLSDTLVQVIDLATNTFLVNDLYGPLSTAGVTSYTSTWTSTSALQINLGPDAWNVGIDNIVYSAVPETAAPVPLPASSLLLGFGLLALGRFRRKA